MTRGADFTTAAEQHPRDAQDITATQQSGNNKLGGALGSLQNPSGAILGTTIRGHRLQRLELRLLAAGYQRGGGQRLRRRDRERRVPRLGHGRQRSCSTSRSNTLFGQATAGDPYVEYDSAAGHWYVTGIDGTDNSKELLAISNDANPTDGFSNVYDVPLAASGDLADFAKFGYNSDAIVIEANDFGDGHSVVTAVDKAQAIAGNLVDYQSTPCIQLPRPDAGPDARTPSPGGPMWFMASTGDPTYDGTTPNTIRVTEMTNILSQLAHLYRLHGRR